MNNREERRKHGQVNDSWVVQTCASNFAFEQEQENLSK